MTTIAANLLEMAGDSFCDAAQPFPTKKIFRIRGKLYGVCGNLDEAMLAIEWLQNGARQNDKPVFTDDSVDILELGKDGLFILGKTLARIPILQPYYAIGSGGSVAEWCLKKGLSPESALELACEVDKHSKPPIHVEALKKGKCSK